MLVFAGCSNGKLYTAGISEVPTWPSPPPAASLRFEPSSRWHPASSRGAPARRSPTSRCTAPPTRSFLTREARPGVLRDTPSEAVRVGCLSGRRLQRPRRVEDWPGTHVQDWPARRRVRRARHRLRRGHTWPGAVGNPSRRPAWATGHPGARPRRRSPSSRLAFSQLGSRRRAQISWLRLPHCLRELREVVLLGSTGSVGTQAIDVMSREPDRFRVVAIAGGGAPPGRACCAGHRARRRGGRGIAGHGRSRRPAGALRGGQARGSRSRRFLHAEGAGGPRRRRRGGRRPCDVVLNGITGSVGLTATLVALKAGRTLALANKESLIAGGPLVVPVSRPDHPVDSEHSAIAQCLRSGPGPRCAGWCSPRVEVPFAAVAVTSSPGDPRSRPWRIPPGTWVR